VCHRRVVPHGQLRSANAEEIIIGELEAATGFLERLQPSPPFEPQNRSILTTQRYIDGDTDAQRKLVSLI
jgi:hypothetical protein